MKSAKMLGLFLVLILQTQTSLAANLTGTTGYYGTIAAVMPGWYGVVGVQLQDGVTCNGRPYVVLPTSNSFYPQIYAALLAVKLAGSYE